MIAAVALAAPLMLGVPGAADPVPQCQHAVIEQNSGNGPNIRMVVCDALRASDGEGWQLIVDGGPLRNGAVIFGVRRP